MGRFEPDRLSEDYISAHIPNRGRSASQVLQDNSTLTSVRVWGKRKLLKCRLRCVYSCLDLVNSFKTMNRSRKITDWTPTTTIADGLKDSNKWQPWKRFFNKVKNNNNSDVIDKKENKENQKIVRNRRNAALFVPDYEEEQTSDNSDHKRKGSLELCDLEDSGTFDMNSDDNK